MAPVEEMEQDEDAWVQGEAQEHREEKPEIAQEVAERPRPVRLRRPREPTEQERQEHERLHEPYRAWCPACVSGRGRVEYHLTQDRGENAIPVVGVDYGFMTNKVMHGMSEEEAAREVAAADVEVDEHGVQLAPILGGRWTMDRWILGRLLPSKGTVHAYNIESLTRIFASSGVKKFFVRSDNEKALKALISRSSLAVLHDRGVQAVADPAPEGDSNANGLAEGAIKELKAKVRTLKFALEQLLNVRIDSSHQCLPFLIMHAAATINRGRRGPDGRTAYELRFGKPWNGKIAEFGEKVMYLGPGSRKSRLDTGYQEGVFFGLNEDQVGYYIGVPGKVTRARAIKLLDESRRRDRELFLAVKGVPWQLDPAVKELEVAPALVKVEAGPAVTAGSIPPPPPARAAGAGDGRRRQVYIRKAVELVKYGYAQGCEGCPKAELGLPPVSHSSDCRARITEAMKVDEGAAMKKRVDEAETRVAEDQGKRARRAVEDAETGPEPASGSGGPASREPFFDVQNPASAGAASSAAAAMPAVDRMRDSVKRAPEVETEDLRGRERPEGEDLDMGSLECASADLLAMSGVRVDVAELFSPAGFAAKATAFNLVAGPAYDLRLDMDMVSPEGKSRAWKELEVSKPWLVVGSPPRGKPSILQALSKQKGSEEFKEAVEAGIGHLNYCMDVYTWQHRQGRFFLHEHPASAWSWDVPKVQEVASLDGVFVVIGDQCMMGARLDGEAIRTRTKWMTNSEELMKVLGKTCDGSHGHRELAGGTVKRTERYSEKLISVVFRALRRQLVRGGHLGALEAGPTAEEPELVYDPEMAKVDERKFYDEYTGLELPAAGVVAARKAEIDYMNRLGTWQVARRSDACANGEKVIGTRWIDCNKGDTTREDLRSRLVAQETRRVSSIADGDIAATFAATPPLEALRFLLSLAMTLPRQNGEDWVLVFIDISRAHPHCDVRRRIVVELPAEAGYSKDFVGVLAKCLYGI